MEDALTLRSGDFHGRVMPPMTTAREPHSNNQGSIPFAAFGLQGLQFSQAAKDFLLSFLPR
jgi:hypothetical protein